MRAAPTTPPPHEPPSGEGLEDRPALDLSVVVPVYDEEQNLPILHAEIAAALNPMGVRWEVLYVDDRSSDGSLAVMLGLWREDPHVRVVQLRGRSGQTAAMAAGFDHARGRVVVTLDGDLQNDPADIPALIERLGEDYDVVAGWRKKRHDGFVLRRLPSIVANRLIGLVTGVRIHDTGCTLKAFRHEVVSELSIYAEQHRFLPQMSAGSGARVTEMVVNHRPRRFGRSKYGLGRATRVLLDLFVIKMISSFSQRPLQYFALLALPWALATPVLLVTGWDGGDAQREQVLLLAFTLSFMACAYFVLLGLLAELAVKASGLHQSEGGRRILARRMEG
jgi:glycosyltransferase involved in cell wall biosynthesis